MKRVLWAATVVVLVLGALGQGQIREEVWARLPDTEKLAFPVQDASGRTTLSISAFILTCANLRAFTDDPAYDCQVVDLMTSLFGGRTPMFVFVGNPSGSAQSFSPTTFVFRQGSRQWGLGGDDFFEMHAPFSGSIPSGTVGSGFIAIPAQVDLAESFRLEYGSAFGVLTPRPGEQPGLPPVVTPPVDPPPVVTPAAPIRVPQDHAGIAEAIAAAPEGGEIRVAWGTYRGDVTITKPLTMVGEPGTQIVGTVVVRRASVVSLSNLEIRGRLQIQDVSTSATLDRISVIGSPGDGMSISNSVVRLASCTVRDSERVGISISGDSRVLISDSTVSGSGAEGVVLRDNTQATIQGSVIRENEATGIHARDPSEVTVVNCTVTENNPGIAVDTSGTTTITDSTIRGNGRWGITIGTHAVAAITRCVISNTGTGVTVSGQASITDSTISGNSAGIFIDATRPGVHVRIEGNRIIANRAYGVRVRRSSSRMGAWVYPEVSGHGNEMRDNGTDLWGNVPGALRAPLVAATETRIVYPDPRYPSLQHAVDALVPGGRLILQGGEHTAGLTITKAVEIEAQPGETVVLRARNPETAVLSLVGGAELTMTGLTLTGGHYGLFMGADARATVRACELTENNTGVELWGAAELLIERSLISGNAGGVVGGDGVRVDLDDASARVTIHGCEVSANRRSGVAMWGYGEVRIETSFIAGNGQYGVRAGGGVRVVGSRNVIPGPGTRDGNELGAVTPAELGFLMTREGGEYGVHR